jgi:hypothetical protein
VTKPKIAPPKPTKEQVEAYYREWLARTYPNGTRETCVCKRSQK